MCNKAPAKPSVLFDSSFNMRPFCRRKTVECDRNAERKIGRTGTTLKRETSTPFPQGAKSEQSNVITLLLKHGLQLSGRASTFCRYCVETAASEQFISFSMVSSRELTTTTIATMTTTPKDSLVRKWNSFLS